MRVRFVLTMIPILGISFIMKLSTYLSSNKIDERAFGEKLGVSEFAVRKWRYGQRTPDVEMIQAISDLTNGSVGFTDWLSERVAS